jgi:hypothetical protein
MKRILATLFALSAYVAHAEVFRCPPTYPDQTYPIKDKPNAPLTGAEVMFGDRPTSGPPYPDGWLTPDEIAQEGGMDFRYALSENEQGWLICTYGARKRIKGRFHGAKESGQHMEPGQPWFIRLPQKVTACTVHVRETQPLTWVVTAECAP